MKSRFLISKMKKPILFFLRLLECLLYLKSKRSQCFKNYQSRIIWYFLARKFKHFYYEISFTSYVDKWDFLEWFFKHCENIPISFSVEGHPKHIHVTKDEEERTTRERSEVTQMISITQKFLLVWGPLYWCCLDIGPPQYKPTVLMLERQNNKFGGDIPSILIQVFEQIFSSSKREFCCHECLSKSLTRGSENRALSLFP